MTSRGEPLSEGSSSQGPASAPLGDEGIRGLDDLLAAMRTMSDAEELKRFLRDLCTHAELEAMAHRWEIAGLLDAGLPYLEIAEQAGAATATVTRVAQWLHHGAGGYRLALERTKAQPPDKRGGK